MRVADCRGVIYYAKGRTGISPVLVAAGFSLRNAGATRWVAQCSL
jgi:hypothetical protein